MPVEQGVLRKLPMSGKSHGAQSRYFVLQGGAFLRYYTSSPFNRGSKIKGALALTKDCELSEDTSLVRQMETTVDKGVWSQWLPFTRASVCLGQCADKPRLYAHDARPRDTQGHRAGFGC